MNIEIGEIENLFNDIFGNYLIKDVDTVYEMADDGKYYKLIIALDNLVYKDIVLLHTKFIFNVDLDKTFLINNSFKYLFDINCQYKMMNFSTILQLEEIIKGIMSSNSFGDDLKIVSDFLISPAMFLNYYFNREKVQDISIYDFQYEPNPEMVPCSEISFKFVANISNKYDIVIIFKKKSNSNYEYLINGLDTEIIKKTNDIKSFSFVIGSFILELINIAETNKL